MHPPLHLYYTRRNKQAIDMVGRVFEENTIEKEKDEVE